jgi:hypothetical protein
MIMIMIYKMSRPSMICVGGAPEASGGQGGL